MEPHDIWNRRDLPRDSVDHRTHAMIVRLFVTGEILRSFRYGMDAAEVNSGIVDQLGKTSIRTTRRDLCLLQTLGLVEYVKGKWRWLAKQSLLVAPMRTSGRGVASDAELAARIRQASEAKGREISA